MKRANGTGSVHKIKGNRRLSWRVTTTVTDPITYRKKKLIIGYAATKKEGLELLSKYLHDPKFVDNNKYTFANIYEMWRKHDSSLSPARKRVYTRMYDKCAKLHDKCFRDVKHSDFDGILENETHTNNIEIKNLFSKMSQYALEHDYIVKDYSKFLHNKQKKEKIVDRKVYTEHEIQLLWNNLYKYREVDTVLIMIYTGLRIGEILKLKRHNIDFANRVITGAGIKTEAGRNRLVPIHSKIKDLLEDRYNNAGVNDYLFNMQGDSYATRHQYFKRTLDKMVELGLEKHTAHDCRHTFATRMNNVNANTTVIKNVIGHSSFETTEKIYTHKDIESMIKEVEKLN